MQPLSFGARLGLAFVAFFRILGDGAVAARFSAVKERMPALPSPPVTSRAEAPSKGAEDGALVMLALLQRGGRFIDFVMQDVAGFSDADVGAAARLVHDGCHAILASHAPVSPIRSEDEGSEVTVEATTAGVVLVGNVSGEGPFAGILRHKGWRAPKVSLPTPTGDYDRTLLAPAEVEL